VCINQEDTVERNQQVQIMAEIYEGAGHLLVWLGPSNHETDLAMNILYEHENSWKALDELKPLGTTTWSSPILTYGPSDSVEALMSFYSKPWFKRCWVVQEYVLGARSGQNPACSNRTTFHCGSKHVVDVITSCSPLLKEVVTLYRKINKYKRHSQLRRLNQDRIILCIDMLERFVSLWQNATISKGSTIDQLEMMMRCSWYEASDRRDIIYAFIGLGKRIDRNSLAKRYYDGILIDYNAPMVDIYASQVKSIISTTGCLDVLGLCYYSIFSLYGSFAERSWVPAWHKDHQRGVNRQSLIFRELSWATGDFPIMSYNTAKGLACRAHVTEDLTRLHATGVPIDTVSFVIDARALLGHLSATVQHLVDVTLQTEDPGSITEALRKTVFEGVCERMECLLYWPHWQTEEEAYLRVRENYWDPIEERERSYHRPRETPKDVPFTPCWKMEEYKLRGPKRHSQRLLSNILDKCTAPMMSKRIWTSLTDPDRPPCPPSVEGCLFVTKQGYVGRSAHRFPEGVALDVCVLFGCRMPVVLEQREGHYKLCGEVFVDDIMFGEAIDALDRGEMVAQEFEIR
jgi:hypothetical protein